MNKIERIDTKKCNISITLKDGTKLTVPFKGSERVNQYFEVHGWWFGKKIRTYLEVESVTTAVTYAERYIYQLVEDDFKIINNKLVKFSDMASVEITDIQENFVPVNHRRYYYD